MGPNKPCPCGSGKKTKKCHPFGAPMIGPEPEQRNLPPVVKDRGADMMLMAVVLTLTCGRFMR